MQSQSKRRIKMQTNLKANIPWDLYFTVDQRQQYRLQTSVLCFTFRLFWMPYRLSGKLVFRKRTSLLSVSKCSILELWHSADHKLFTAVTYPTILPTLMEQNCARVKDVYRHSLAWSTLTIYIYPWSISFVHLLLYFSWIILPNVRKTQGRF